MAPPTIMQWEYLDPNTVRTYDIPIHIATPADYTFEGLSGLPQGFTPMQQFPYPSPGGASGPPPPPTSISDHQSILIQRVPHRHRKSRNSCKALKLDFMTQSVVNVTIFGQLSLIQAILFGDFLQVSPIFELKWFKML